MNPLAMMGQGGLTGGAATGMTGDARQDAAFTGGSVNVNSPQMSMQTLIMMGLAAVVVYALFARK